MLHKIQNNKEIYQHNFSYTGSLNLNEEQKILNQDTDDGKHSNTIGVLLRCFIFLYTMKGYIEINI